MTVTLQYVLFNNCDITRYTGSMWHYIMYCLITVTLQYVLVDDCQVTICNCRWLSTLHMYCFITVTLKDVLVDYCDITLCTGRLL